MSIRCADRAKIKKEVDMFDRGSINNDVCTVHHCDAIPCLQKVGLRFANSKVKLTTVKKLTRLHSVHFGGK